MAQLAMTFILILVWILLGIFLVVTVTACAVGVVTVFPPVFLLSIGRGFKRLFFPHKWSLVSEMDILPAGKKAPSIDKIWESDEFDQLYQEVRCLKDRISSFTDKIPVTKSEFEVLKTEVHGLRDKNFDPQAQISKSEITKSEFESLKAEVHGLRDKVMAPHPQISKSDFDSLKREVLGLHDNVVLPPQAMTPKSEFEDLKLEVLGLRDRLRDSHPQISKPELESIKNDVSKLREDISNLDQKIKAKIEKEDHKTDEMQKPVDEDDPQLRYKAEKILSEVYEYLATPNNQRVDFASLYREAQVRLPELSKKFFQAIVKELLKRGVLDLHTARSENEITDKEVAIQTTAGWLYFVSWRRFV